MPLQVLNNRNFDKYVLSNTVRVSTQSTFGGCFLLFIADHENETMMLT